MLWILALPLALLERVVVERDPDLSRTAPPAVKPDRLEPPRIAVAPGVYLGPDWRHGKAWCGPRCPERNVHYVSSGLRGAVRVAPNVEVFVAAGPLFGPLWREREASERVNGYATAGVEAKVFPIGRVIAQLGYSPALGFDCNGGD